MDKKIDKIALRLNKNRSSIYREIKRNNYRNNYLPDTAHKKYVKRRSRKGLSKIRNDIALYSYIKERLQAGCSPQQISG
jgi:IS30 family transposase